jgi:tight adherence protein C
MNFAELLPAGVSPEDAMVAMAGAAAFISILIVWFTLLERDPGAKRAAAVAERYGTLKAALNSGSRRKRQTEASVNIARRVVERLKLTRGRPSMGLSDRLTQAGLRSRDAVVVFLFMKVAMPIALGLAALVYLYVLNPEMIGPEKSLLAALAAAGLGLFLPDIYIKNAADKRKDKIRKSLPDGLDLMVICAEAGLSLDATFSRVAGELGSAAPEMADELSIAAIELGLMPERRTALENLQRRCDLPHLRAMVGTLQQTEKYGTPLAQALRVLASELRDERLLKAEDKAARLPAILTVPMIIFILPCLFVVMLGPAALRMIDGLGKIL